MAQEQKGGIKTLLRKRYEDATRSGGLSALTKKSLNWFYDYTRQIVKSSSYNQSKNLGVVTTTPVPGRFYLYQYDPKTKDTLPYYDTLPLIIITSLNENGWTGINFHYMPPVVRLKIMEEMLDTLNNPTMSQDMKIKMNWKKANVFAKAAGANQYLQHSVKRYLVGHVKSPLIEIRPEHWEMALFLPLSRFKKKTSSYIWGNV